VTLDTDPPATSSPRARRGPFPPSWSSATRGRATWSRTPVAAPRPPGRGRGRAPRARREQALAAGEAAAKALEQALTEATERAEGGEAAPGRDHELQPGRLGLPEHAARGDGAHHRHPKTAL